MNPDANAPFQYLASCSKVSLESFEMSELNKASMRRKEVLEVLEVLDAWIEAEVNARLARWVLEHRRRDPNVCIDSMVKIDDKSAPPQPAPPQRLSSADRDRPSTDATPGSPTGLTTRAAAVSVGPPALRPQKAKPNRVAEASAGSPDFFSREMAARKQSVHLSSFTLENRRSLTSPKTSPRPRILGATPAAAVAVADSDLGGRKSASSRFGGRLLFMPSNLPSGLEATFTSSELAVASTAGISAKSPVRVIASLSVSTPQVGQSAPRYARCRGRLR